jgi:hypothetical protein
MLLEALIKLLVLVAEVFIEAVNDVFNDASLVT